MSKILVFAPQRMIQQAIVLSLFSDHDVQLCVGLGENSSPAVNDFDLAIVDATALRNVKAPATQLLKRIQDGKIPTVWIEEAGGDQEPCGDNLAVLKRPIQKDALQSAVAACLTSLDAKPHAKRRAVKKEKSRSPRTTAKQASIDVAPHVTGFQVIELVDVVEEAPERNQNNKQQGKTK
jgi:hypothetical protein